MSMRRLWVPVLVALLVAALLGPGVVGAAEPRVTMTRTVMVPAAAAIPVDRHADYHSFGNYLAISSGEGSFLVPVSFPVPVVTIKRITLYAYDNTPGESIHVTLMRPYPPGGISLAPMGNLQTADGSADPQTATLTQISPRLVNTSNYGLCLWVYITAPGLRFYGVKILYSYEV